MSTSELAVADVEEEPRLWSERLVAVGSGLLRLADGSYQAPISAYYCVRCLGPLAHFKVAVRFDISKLPEGPDRLFCLYPLPPEASLISLGLAQSSSLEVEHRICSDDDAPEGAESFQVCDGLVRVFAAESQPVLTVNLDSFKEQFVLEEALEVQLEYSSWSPTEDGRISLGIPGRVDDELGASGQTILTADIYIEESGELVDEPKTSVAFEQEREEDLLHLKIAELTLKSDVLISFRPGRTEMPITRLRRNSEHFLFSIYPPTSIPASPQRRDLVFAIDASENVLGGLFEIVCADVIKILRELDDNDRFALVTYGRDIDGYQGGEFCDVSCVEEACSWLGQVEPRGRADVQPLLTRIQDLPSQPDRQLCVFLLAAGHVGNEPAIIESLDFDQSDRRYYALGIGLSAHQAFLRRLALLARGRYVVAPDGYCHLALSRLLSQTRALLAEVVLEDQGGEDLCWRPESQVPSRMGSLTPEGPVHCLGQGSPESLRFRSKDETGVFFAGTVNAVRTENEALSKAWASLRVRELLDCAQLVTSGKRQQLREEAIALAKANGVLTEGTVLALSTASFSQVQLSVMPSLWLKSIEGESEPTSDKIPAPVDWRKGLKAREGVFKGHRMGESAETAIDGGRPGLRRPSDPGAKVAKPGQDTGKPRLERHYAPRTPEVEAVETTVVAPGPQPAEETQSGLTKAQGEASVQATSRAAEDSVNLEVVVVKQAAEPSFDYRLDPLVGANVRMESYLNQANAAELKWGLASLAALPAEVSSSGSDLPRILAQTVGHLEKRGYYSAAVSVLGLMLRDYQSSEVLKKLELLLVAWAGSLSSDYLPEAVQIVQAGLRIMPDSQLLKQSYEGLSTKWRELSRLQKELPAVVGYREISRDLPKEPILSGYQLELASFSEKQSKLESKLSFFKEDVDAKFLELTGRLEELAASSLDSLSGALAKLTAEAARSSSQKDASRVDVDDHSLSQVAEGSLPLLASPAALTSKAEPEPLEKSLESSQAMAEPAPLEKSLDSAQAMAEPAPVEKSLESAQAIAEPAPFEKSLDSAQAIAEPAPLEKSLDSAQAMAEPAPLEKSLDSAQAMAEPALVDRAKEVLELTRDELFELLQADPRDASGHQGVKRLLPDPKERIGFYRDLARLDKDVIYHSLSLARAYHEGDQTKVAAIHYQKYLRTERDAQAYLELAEVYDELGKEGLGVSARRTAELILDGAKTD